MSDFYSVLRQSIIDRDLRTAREREEAYSQARGAMVRQLWSYDPPLAEDEIDARIGQFDQAVERIESDLQEAFAVARGAAAGRKRPAAGIARPARRLPAPAPVTTVVDNYDEEADYAPAFGGAQAARRRPVREEPEPPPPPPPPPPRAARREAPAPVESRASAREKARQLLDERSRRIEAALRGELVDEEPALAASPPLLLSAAPPVQEAEEEDLRGTVDANGGAYDPRYDEPEEVEPVDPGYDARARSRPPYREDAYRQDAYRNDGRYEEPAEPEAVEDLDPAYDARAPQRPPYRPDAYRPDDYRNDDRYEEPAYRDRSHEEATYDEAAYVEEEEEPYRDDPPPRPRYLPSRRAGEAPAYRDDEEDYRAYAVDDDTPRGEFEPAYVPPAPKEYRSKSAAERAMRAVRRGPGAGVRTLAFAVAGLAVLLVAVSAFIFIPMIAGGGSGGAIATATVGDPAAAPSSAAVTQSISLFDGRDPTVFQPDANNPIRYSGSEEDGFARISTSVSSAGARAVIGPGLSARLAGHNVRLTIDARSSEQSGAATLRFAYQSGLAISHWQNADLDDDFRGVSLEWRVPGVRTNQGGDYIMIEPGVPGDGTAVDIRSIRIDVLDR